MDGNQMKMREALEAAHEFVYTACRQNIDIMVKDKNGERVVKSKDVLYKIYSALSEPARNCDIHTDFNDAITTLANKRNWHDGKWDSERYCILASWLLAPAEERKGERNDYL